MTTESDRGVRTRSPLAKLVFGPGGLRAGYRLAIYCALFLALFALNDLLRAHFPTGMQEFLRFGIVEALAALDLIVASAIMARLEKRPVSAYGLPPPRRHTGQFAWGIALGFGWVTIAIAALAAAGAYRILGVGGRPGDMALYGALFAVLALTIGLKEELYYRGYALFTLATGLRFWPAAVLSSLWFGVQHIVFAHVTWLGGFNITLGGLIFCIMVRGTGNLWMAIGAHAAIDWAEAFLYGVPVSGSTIQGAVIHSTITGPAWLSGGPAGPEGSILFTASMLPVAWGLGVWMSRVRVRSQRAVQDGASSSPNGK